MQWRQTRFDPGMERDDGRVRPHGHARSPPSHHIPFGCTSQCVTRIGWIGDDLDWRTFSDLTRLRVPMNAPTPAIESAPERAIVSHFAPRSVVTEDRDPRHPGYPVGNHVTRPGACTVPSTPYQSRSAMLVRPT